MLESISHTYTAVQQVLCHNPICSYLQRFTKKVEASTEQGTVKIRLLGKKKRKKEKKEKALLWCQILCILTKTSEELLQIH